MNILTKEMISMAKKDDQVEGIVFLRYLKRQLSTNNVPYLSGEIETKEKFSVIMWNKCSEYTTYESGLNNVLVFIKSNISDFCGRKSLHLTHIEILDEQMAGINVEDLKCIRYNKQVYQNATLTFLKDNVSNKGYALLDKIMEFNSNTGLWSKFSVEYAAKGVHDNCEVGLLAHTYKCLRMLEFLKKPYGFMNNLSTAEIPNHTDIQDLMFMGVFLHDVGKVFEMKEGIYQNDSFNTHRILGLQILYKYHDELVTAYNEHWFQALISIIVGHHNEFGEKATTLYAYITYMIDSFEATMTTFEQIITPELSSLPGSKFTYNDNVLNL